jgi:putative oxidoreductase
MNIAFLIGRIIAGGFFLFNSFHHFTRVKMMAGYAKSKGTPAPEAAIFGTGILLLLGGFSVLLGYRTVIGIAFLVIFLLGVSFKMHNFWAVPDPQMKMFEQVNFLKNMGLLGLLLMLLAIPQPWPMSFGR